MEPDRQQQFDLIVLGGGPGGSTVATLVAQQGHRVLLLERATFPRHQIGESLLPTTIHGICRLLGVREELAQQNFPKKLGVSFLWGKSAEPWSFIFEDSPVLRRLGFNHAYQVERARFDEILLRNAQRKGVDVRENHTAHDIVYEDGRFRGVCFTDASGHEHTALARHVVDASGHRGAFVSRVGERVYSEFFRNIAVYGYFEGGKRFPPPSGRQCSLRHIPIRVGMVYTT